MTPAEMDELFARHCAAEAANDVDAIMDTLAEEVEHDAVGDPQGVLYDHAAIAQRYRDLFSGLNEDKMESVHRYYGADFFVDESHWYGTATGTLMGIPGNGRPLNFRILHVCEIRGNKISRENVWLDTAAIMQQLMGPA